MQLPRTVAYVMSECFLAVWTIHKPSWLCGLYANLPGCVDYTQTFLAVWTVRKPSWLCGLYANLPGCVDCTQTFTEASL